MKKRVHKIFSQKQPDDFVHHHDRTPFFAVCAAMQGQEVIAKADKPFFSKTKNTAQQSNKTGLPIQLKTALENLSGYSLDAVRVHYNSEEPAKLQAHAFARGTDIYLAPGQEEHLPHEAWHVVQQMQGRAQPTRQIKGQGDLNDNAELERESNVIEKHLAQAPTNISTSNLVEQSAQPVIQRLKDESGNVTIEKVQAESNIATLQAWGKKAKAGNNPADLTILKAIVTRIVVVVSEFQLGQFNVGKNEQQATGEGQFKGD